MKQVFTYLRIAFCCGIIFSGFSCNNPNEGKAAARKIDSVSRLNDSLERVIAARDSLRKTDSTAKTAVKPATDSPAPVLTEKTVRVSPKNPPPKPNAASDSTIYYYTGTPKRVSVIITPWLNSKRKVILFNQAGKQTYVFDDVRTSHIVSTTIKNFHPNGAAQNIHVHENPGGSRYMYETDYSFDSNNEPQWKTESQSPQDKLESDTKFSWDKTSRTWKKAGTTEMKIE